MKFSYLLMAASIGLLAACSGLEQPEQDLFMDMEGDLVEKVIFEVLPIIDGDNPETKASAVPNGGTVGFIWEASDTVGIYPDKGSQVYFNIEDGVGTSSVSFTGGGWALKQNSTYTSYYPFVGDIYLKRDKIPVSFAGQKQIGTTSPFVGARYYLATEASTSEHGVLRFSYSTLNTIINVNATLPAGTYTKMSLTIEEPLFIEEGTYSLDEREIVGTKFTNTLEIELEDVVLTEEATIPVYIMSAPVDLKGKEVAVRITTADGSSYKCIKTPTKEYMAGTRYGLTCNEMEREERPQNVIYYKSSDGTVVDPYRPEAFDASILSNEYVNGLGILTFDGDLTSIGENAFLNCTSLTSITIPASVTSLNGAFIHCTGLSSITLPDYVTSIGDYTFYDCSCLISITIPSSVISVGNRAFYGCSSLTGITIPDSLTSIDDYTFEGCSSISNITIPDSITSIGIGAFSGCTSLMSFSGRFASQDGLYLIDSGCLVAVAMGAINGDVSIPNSVISIGGGAFGECTSLTTITIPNSVTSIGDSAFGGCTSLTSVSIPNSVISIGRAAFVNCLNLPSITIPNSVASIESSTFYGCTSLTSITIPNSITRVGDSAFAYCTHLSSITIPDSVTSIGRNAFDGCSSLVSITIPNSVTSIGDYAFSNCTSLSSIMIPNSVTSIGLGTFRECTSLTNITIPDSISSIENYSFIDCSTLSYIIIPGSVKSIGTSAFRRCTSLTSITIPDSVTSIGLYAFNGCSSLVNITIPKSVTSIGREAFSSCTSLTGITLLPITPPNAGSNLFNETNECPIYVPAESVEAYKTAPVWSDYANLIQAIPEPNNVIYYTSYNGGTVIPFYGEAFGANMVSNEYVNGRGIITFDGDVTGILADAFKNCSGLTSITIPESVTRIGTNAFYYCQRLTSITIPESVTSISSEAFYYCNSLTSLVIPKNVTSIGNYAFSYCNSLSSITINALSPPTLEYGTAFEFTSFPIYVPEESVEAYKAADGWSGYSNRIYPIVS